MAKWTNYYKIVTPATATTKMVDSQEMADVGAYNNYTWYQRLIQGSASRMTRYREYDLMDNDVEVSRALDTIAEEMAGNMFNTSEPLLLEIIDDAIRQPEGTTVLTLKAALRRWSQIHDWSNKLFTVSRMTAKYGDVFFRRSKNSHEPWFFIHPKNVIAAVVDVNNVNNVVGWQIKKDINKPRMGGTSLPLGARLDNQYDTEIVPSEEIIRFSLNDDMSDTSPFGESVLRPVYRSHKQKELLEDAVIIYRVQRAPERRVFYIDVGKMPPQRVKQYLETIKNEIKQKKIPSINGGQTEVDTTYNPQSMSEDFFFASRPDGRGSRVETLPGGQGLGELSDLEYFQRKVWRGLRVPASYMIEQSEGGQIWNDGKVGVAYIQELRFAQFIERLQGFISKTLDKEFKRFLRDNSIFIDESIYYISVPEPSNFGKYRQLELDSALLSSYGTADGIQYLSKRFILEKYLMLDREEIARNEYLKKEEMGIDPTSGSEDLPKLYGGEEGALMGGGGGGLGSLGGGLGGTPMGMEAGGEEPIGGEEGGEAAGGTVGEVGTVGTAGGEPAAGGEETPAT